MNQQVSWNRKVWPILALVAVAVLALAAACTGSGAEQAAAPEPTAIPPTAAPAEPAIPVVAIEANDSGLAVAEVVPGSIVQVDITNSGDNPAAVSLFRMREGHTRQELNEFKAVADANPEAFFGIFELAGFIHGIEGIPPGTTSTFYADLGTGEFILSDDAHPERDPMFFRADEATGTTEPAAAVTVDMLDFAYTMPNTVPAGPGLWEFTNSGDQWHLAAMTTYNPDATPEQLLALFSEEGGPPPADAPVQVVGGLPPMSPGERVWIEMDLPPGEYQLLCPLPDVVAMAEGGEPLPHLLHGMQRRFTVEN